jgi:predicted membrane channel-forming protein YqfA (hemolysin III family)
MKTSTPIAEACIKLCFVVQTVSLYLMVSSAPEGCTVMAGCIYFLFVPGFIAYGANFPRENTKFGAHEVFHLSILLGFCSSMVCEVLHLQQPCASSSVVGAFGNQSISPA